MSPVLSRLNLAGIAVLALLCVLQWRANRQLHLENATLVRTRAGQAGQLADLERQRRGLAADLENFRGQLERSVAELRAADGKLAITEQGATQLAAQNEQLKQNVASWSAAVTARDERLTEANDRIRELGARLEDSVLKFNDLARRYNDTVRQYEELGARYQQAVARLNTARGAEGDRPPTGSP